MTSTPADWVKLTEGTTPAPWETLREDDTPVWTIGRLGDNPARIVGDVYGEENAHLAASAPEAVAEVVRLRRELEARVRVWGRVANKLESVDHMSNAEVVRHHIGQLTRILEGES